MAHTANLNLKAATELKFLTYNRWNFFTASASKWTTLWADTFIFLLNFPLVCAVLWKKKTEANCSISNPSQTNFDNPANTMSFGQAKDHLCRSCITFTAWLDLLLLAAMLTFCRLFHPSFEICCWENTGEPDGSMACILSWLPSLDLAAAYMHQGIPMEADNFICLLLFSITKHHQNTM